MFFKRSGKRSGTAAEASRTELRRTRRNRVRSLAVGAGFFSSAPGSLGHLRRGGPGEFTRLFQASQNASSPALLLHTAALPQRRRLLSSPGPYPPGLRPLLQRGSSSPALSGPGEFTRIFCESFRMPSRLRLHPRHPARFPGSSGFTPHCPGAPRMKDFLPALLTRHRWREASHRSFSLRPAAAAPPPAPAPTPVSAPPVQSYTPPAPIPAPPPAEFKWPAPSDFGASTTEADSGTGSTSATSLFASLAATEARPEPARTKPVEPFPSYAPAPTPSYSPAPTPSYSSAPLPSYTPEPPAAPSAPEAGSVTRLIQRLSEGTKAPPLVESSPATPAPPPVHVDSGLGEFTRMIFHQQHQREHQAPAAAPACSSAAPAAAAPAFAVPPIPKPAVAMPPMPAAPPPAPAMAAPKFEPPKAPAIPKPAPPAVAAPAGKFQEMVPILLVVNTFLLLVLIVLVIFELKGK